MAYAIGPIVIVVIFCVAKNIWAQSEFLLAYIYCDMGILLAMLYVTALSTELRTFSPNETVKTRDDKRLAKFEKIWLGIILFLSASYLVSMAILCIEKMFFL